jgi:hypothetical protein
MKPEYDNMKKTYDYLLDMQRIRNLPPEDVSNFAVEQFENKISQLSIEGRRLDEIANKLNQERMQLEKSGASKAEILKKKKEWGNARKKADLVILDEDIYIKAKENSQAYIDQLIEKRKQFFRDNNEKFVEARKAFEEETEGRRPFLISNFGQAFGEIMTVADNEEKENKLASRKDVKFISINSLGLRERFALYDQVKDIEFRDKDTQAWKGILFAQIEKDINQNKSAKGKYYLLPRNKSKFFQPKKKAEPKKPARVNPFAGGLLAELRKKAGKAEQEAEEMAEVVEKKAKVKTSSLLEAIRSRGKSEEKQLKTEIKKETKNLEQAADRFQKFQERKKKEVGFATEKDLIAELQKRQKQIAETEL